MKIKIFLAGDVMLGRGIDQILPYPSFPQIYEPAVADAREYVFLAEAVFGKIDYPVTFDYIWGDALGVIKKARPEIKIINLETTITTSEDYLGKGINYRLNPQNVEALKSLGVDVCALANNHILDWGPQGLLETIEVLQRNKISTVGAAKNSQEAKRPAIFGLGKGRIVILAFAHPSCGSLAEWEAGIDKPGINLLPDLSQNEVGKIKEQVDRLKQAYDFLVFSIHWGPNWGYEIERKFINLAHSIIDHTGVDLVFGHSSHHFKGIEIYKDKLIIYSAGDFINDYEGISGYEEFRGDLSLMYFPELDLTSKKLVSLTLVPMQIKKFRLSLPSKEDIDWTLKVLQKESAGSAREKFRLIDGEFFSIKLNGDI